MICRECETVAHCLKNGCVPKHQPALKPLTDEQTKQILKNSELLEMFENVGWYSAPRKAFNENGLRLIRAIEAAHGITEKGQP